MFFIKKILIKLKIWNNRVKNIKDYQKIFPKFKNGKLKFIFLI